MKGAARSRRAQHLFSACFGVACFGMACFGVACFGVASAQAAEVELGDTSVCPGATEVSFLAERALGRPLREVPGPRFVIDVRRESHGFAARLDTQGDASGGDGKAPAVGTRTFGAPSCDELIEALALVVAIALGASPEREPAGADTVAHDAARTPAVPPTAQGPVAAPPPDVSGEPVEARAVEPAAGPALVLLGSFVADSGSLPALGLGAGLGVGLRWSTLELRASGVLLPARHGSVDDRSERNAGAEIGLVLGLAQACAPLSLRTEAIELGVCAGFELGRLHAQGTGVLRPYRKSTLWASPRVDLEAIWFAPDLPWLLRATVGVAVPLQRDEFILRDIGSVHEPANVVARAGVGVGWLLR